MTDTRMCLNCGLTVPASHDRASPGPDCRSPDACTFDLTSNEAWVYWRDKYHKLRAELDRAEARVAELEAALRPFASSWAIATASGQTSMSRLGSYARDETPAIAFLRARAALADKGGE